VLLEATEPQVLLVLLETRASRELLEQTATLLETSETLAQQEMLEPQVILAQRDSRVLLVVCQAPTD